MAITPNKNLELLSAKEQVKSKKYQMLENLKIEMLKNMKLNEKLVKRNSLAKKIFEARKNELFPKQISLQGKTIEIKEKGKYKSIIEQYKKLNSEQPTGYENQTKELDKLLAEQVILDQNKMIEFSSTEQFDGKTAEQEARAVFENLNTVEYQGKKKYEKKIELIKKTNGEEMYFVIKRTKKQLEEIERAEKAYEELHGAEATEPNKKETEAVTPQGTQSGVPNIKNITEEESKLKTQLREIGKQLNAIKIGETIELTPPTGGYIRLKKKDENGRICLTNTVDEFTPFIDENHSIEDENGNKSYISYVSNKKLREFLQIPDEETEEATKNTRETTIENPEPTPEEPQEETNEELGEKEITATISDTTQITRAIAERAAGEKLRNIYKKTARYKPWSRITKAGLFVGRGYMKDYYTRKYMNMKAGMQRDTNLVKAADRHEMEEANKFNENIKKLSVIDQNNYPRTYQELDRLAKKLTGDANDMPPRQKKIEPVDFQIEFKAIIRRNLDAKKPSTATDPNRKSLANIIKDNDIQQMSSNIVEKLEGFRDHQSMVRNIADRITRNPTESDASFSVFTREEIVKYFKKYKKIPEFFKTLNIKIDDKNAMQELRRLQSHQAALTQIAAQTMKLKIQILSQGEEAYDVKQDDKLKGRRGAMTKAGNRLDKPVSDKSRFGKWLNRHPFAKNAFGMLRGGIKLGTMITPGLLLAPLGPLTVASGVGGMAFIKTYLKKHSHYNKEHIGYQRKQAVNLLKNTAERNRLMNEISKMNPAKRFFLYYFGLGKTARDVRHFRDYVMTIHDQLKNSETLGQDIENLLQKPQLTDTEKNTLEKYLAEGLARLDFHKKTGQNFLGSKDKDVAEKEYQTIYRLVLTGAMRLDKDLGDEKNPAPGTLRDNNYYHDTLDLIENGTGKDVDQIGYKQARKRFKHRQTEKALIGAVKAGGIAFGLSYLASSLASTKTKVDIQHHETNFGENFTLGKHELATDNNVYTQSKDFFNNRNPGNTGNEYITFHYGGGTDATAVIPGKLNQIEYINKITEVQNEIMKMSNINNATKTKLIEHINSKPWESVWAEKGFTNDYLHGMRCLEGIEQTIKALNDSKNGMNITIIPNYDGSVHDIVGTTYNNAGERITQGTMEYYSGTITEGVNRAIPIPGFINTFQRRNDEEKKEKGKDNYERKTRTPAPNTKRENKNKDNRRRSGEMIETQFTNANN